MVSDVGNRDQTNLCKLPLMFSTNNQQLYPLLFTNSGRLWDRMVDGTTRLLITGYKVVVLLMCRLLVVNSFCNALYGVRGRVDKQHSTAVNAKFAHSHPNKDKNLFFVKHTYFVSSDTQRGVLNVVETVTLKIVLVLL